ncbi:MULTISPECIES: DUF2283 domain-containing protein [unclassified Corynebacterium]|uniref:DUF2283 domain-containing protein n=1 Tax=unclassified Corynebacterium TaxID=2624378 RepID=UPI0029CA1ED0|nr:MULTISPECIES: DUF2283 domain-containing protein [unclassified Corynebacterium]WPF65990.1 DUF2283 domain-containing protein [Corynebacterium sp. 22KM0430]WPF68483.1 DUF2283 domain-containing protein [Corynebacterium sp. 21KM1197]
MDNDDDNTAVNRLEQFRWEYDPEADAASLTLTPPTASQVFSETQIWGITADSLAGEIVVDIDAEGRVIGIEFLGASAILPPGLLR